MIFFFTCTLIFLCISKGFLIFARKVRTRNERSSKQNLEQNYSLSDRIGWFGTWNQDYIDACKSSPDIFRNWNEGNVGHWLQMKPLLSAAKAKTHAALTRRPISALAPNKSTAQRKPQAASAKYSECMHMCVRVHPCCLLCAGTLRLFPRTVRCICSPSECFSSPLHSSGNPRVQEIKNMTASEASSKAYQWLNTFPPLSLCFQNAKATSSVAQLRAPCNLLEFVR